jgi:hypothetical protein
MSPHSPEIAKATWRTSAQATKSGQSLEAILRRRSVDLSRKRIASRAAATGVEIPNASYSGGSPASISEAIGVIGSVAVLLTEVSIPLVQAHLAFPDELF